MAQTGGVLRYKFGQHIKLVQNMQSHPLPTNNCVPVVKRPRQEWRIPRIDAYAQILQQQQEEATLKALVEGTTPQGREILRKILFRTKRLLQGQTQSVAQIVDAIETEVITFRFLQPEFALLLSRVWGGKEEAWRQIEPRDLATLVVLRTASPGLARCGHRARCRQRLGGITANLSFG